MPRWMVATMLIDDARKLLCTSLMSSVGRGEAPIGGHRSLIEARS